MKDIGATKANLIHTTMAQNKVNKGTTDNKAIKGTRSDAADATKQLTDDQNERDQVRTGLKGDEAVRLSEEAGDPKRKGGKKK